MQDIKQIYTFVGVLTDAGEVDTIASKRVDNTFFQIRKVRIERDDCFKTGGVFTCYDTKLLSLPYAVGTKVKVYFYIKPFNTKNGVGGTTLVAEDIQEYLDVRDEVKHI